MHNTQNVQQQHQQQEQDRERERPQQVMLFQTDGTHEFVQGKISDLTDGWTKHVSLEAITGRKLGIVVEGKGAANSKTTELVRLLRFEFGLSKAGEGAMGRVILYDDTGDITPGDWKFLRRWMVLKQLRGDDENTALHQAHIAHKGSKSKIEQINRFFQEATELL